MAVKTPIRTVFDGSNNATGLAEYQSGEFIGLTHGGLGASLSIGSAGQVLKVNSGASALEFGSVETVFNIDGMTDGTSITIADGDIFAISDGGTEKRITASQIKTYVSGVGGTTITSLDIDGGSDIGAALVDADLLIVDDGAGGTNRKATMARVATYIEGGISGDVTISSGTAAIASGVIVNADINASAAIADSKLATISTAGKVDIGALDIDGASEMGAAIADADLLIVDDGAGGTEKSMLASRIPTYVFTKVSGDATVASNGALTIAAGSVENSMLADDAVGADELAANAVVTASIVNANVTTAKIADSNVTLAKMAANSIDSNQYVDGSIDTAHIANDQITNALMADNAIDTAQIADDAVGADQLASNAVVNASVASNAAIAISKTALTAGTGISLSTNTLNVDAAQTGITSLLATDIKIGEDDQTKIDFETADEIHFYAANAEQVFVSDGVFGPQTDSDVDLGTTGARFKDAFMDSVTVTGNLSIGGNFTVNGTTSTVNSTTVTIDDPIFTLGGDGDASSDDNKDRGIEFKYHTGSAAKLGFFGFDDSTGKFTFIPDATNSSEVFSGTAGTVVASTFEGNLTGNVTGNTSGTAATVTTAAQSNITSLGTLTTLTVDNVIVNGTTIGHTDDTDLITLADGIATVAGEISVTTLDIGGTNVTSTAAELNYSDTGAAVGTVVASKVLTVDANKDVASLRNITLTGELDAGSLDVSGDADIDGTLEADAITVGGVTLAEVISDTVGAMVSSNTESGITVAYQDADNTLDFTIGTLNQNTTGSAATLTTARTIGGTSFDGSANIAVALSTAATTLETARTIAGVSFDGSANIAIASTDLTDVTSTAAELNFNDGVTLGTAIASKTVTTDSNKDTTGQRNLTITGELDAATLDISGNADIDGTLEADAITIGGVSLAETISDTVGAMVSSNTETNITVTYQDADNTLDFAIGTLNQDTTGSAATLTTARTIAGVSFDGSANIAIASTDLSNTSAIALLTASQTMTNKTLTSPQINTQIDMLARAEMRFQDASGGQYVALEAPATVSSNVTFTLPSADGDADQVIVTDGSGALSFADAGGGSGGFSASTIIVAPGEAGDFALTKTNNSGDEESGFETGATDVFGVAIGSVFDLMEPVGAGGTTTDFGAF
jgi:cytoskeletal protein CcmA (bactofilin family)